MNLVVDFPGDSSTGATVTIGSTTDGALEVVGDHDWFAIQLTAGQAITVALNGVSLDDPYLRIHNSAGTVIYENDDSGPGTNSRIAFAAPSTGVYYIDAGAYNDASAGTYQVVVTPYSPPPVGTVDQFVTQLTTGYWGGTSHHFNVTQGGTITVNVSTLSAAGQNLAHEALGMWSDLIGVTFADVTTGGQIMFSDTDTGASTSANYSRGITSTAHVNVAAQWLTNYGTGLNSYSFQTYIHEIGHALGLGHASDYNFDVNSPSTITYPYDSIFANDGWPMSVMSYFDERQNSYYSNQGFTKQYLVSPMLADDVAIGQLYGVSTTTRTGDTTYGFNSTAGRPEFDASLYPTVGYTIFDSGGTDTLDYSGFAQAQKIDLHAEAYSNVGGRVGNITIARGTVIENAIGGSGNDQLIGNAVNNVLKGNAGADTLTGGGGLDIFLDTVSGHSGDTITDFAAGDHIVFSDAALTGFAFSLVGTTLSYSGGSLTLANAPSGRLVASAAAGGGVDLAFAAQQTTAPSTTASTHALNDFNGDGRSDVLWRDDNGTFGDWLGRPAGGFTINDGAALRAVPLVWHIVGTGDFNGDGRADILWRQDDGSVTDWLGQANGGFVGNDAALYRAVTADWHVMGTGDFNGDGRADVLWRNDNGIVTDWLGQANGGFVGNDGALFRGVSADWHVAGTGDFNGDGRTDVLWRNDNGIVTDWLATASGGFVGNDAGLFRGVSADWHVLATGDFNGDGKTDILWRNDNGVVTDWLATANGGFASNDAGLFRQVPASWHVAGTGDYNGDGKDDILWRNDDGSVTDWLATGNGGFAGNDANLYFGVGNNWHIHAPQVMLF